MTGRPHPLISRAARATTRPAGATYVNVSRSLVPPVLRQLERSGSVVSLLPIPPVHAHTAVTSLFFFFFLFLSTASYFKAPLATSKSRQTTSEDAWALFVRLCRYADNEYSNQFNISFAIVDIKCAQNYNKFEAKGIDHKFCNICW